MEVWGAQQQREYNYGNTAHNFTQPGNGGGIMNAKGEHK